MESLGYVISNGTQLSHPDRTVFKIRCVGQIPSFKLHFDHGFVNVTPKQTNLEVYTHELGNLDKVWRFLVNQINQRTHQPHNSNVKKINHGPVVFHFDPVSYIYLSSDKQPLSLNELTSKLHILQHKITTPVTFSGYLVFTLPKAIDWSGSLVPVLCVRTLVIKEIHGLYNEDLDDLELNRDLGINKTKYTRSMEQFRKLTNDQPLHDEVEYNNDDDIDAPVHIDDEHDIDCPLHIQNVIDHMMTCPYSHVNEF